MQKNNGYVYTYVYVCMYIKSHQLGISLMMIPALTSTLDPA